MKQLIKHVVCSVAPVVPALLTPVWRPQEHEIPPTSLLLPLPVSLLYTHSLPAPAGARDKDGGAPGVPAAPHVRRGGVRRGSLWRCALRRKVCKVVEREDTLCSVGVA
jgi:hypothetical protein